MKKWFFRALSAMILLCLCGAVKAAEKEVATIQADVFPMSEFASFFRYQIITKGSDSADKSWMLAYIKNGYTHPGRICFGGNKQKEFSVPADLQPYQWNRVTVCFDGEKAIMYLNGEKIGEMERMAPPENSHKMVIGKYMWGTDMTFPGKVENAFYEKKLLIPEKRTVTGTKTTHLFFRAGDKEVPLERISGAWTNRPTGYQELSDNIDVNALAISKKVMPENFVMTSDFITYDGMGTIALEFCRQENGDGYRVELKVTSALRFLTIYKRENGELSLLEEVNSSKIPLETSGRRGYPLRLTVGRYNGMIHLQINGKDIMNGFDDTFKTGKVGVGAHERKVDLCGISVNSYPEYAVNTVAKAKPQHELQLGTETLRTVFYRDEKIPLNASFVNRSAKEFETGKVTIKLHGKTYTLESSKIPGMKTVGQEVLLDAADLRDGEYTVTAEAGKLKGEFKITLVSRENSDLYRFYNWGGGKIEELDKYHFNGKNVTFTPKDDFRKYRELLALHNDYALKNQMKLGVHWHLQTAIPAGGQKMCILRKDGTYSPRGLSPHREDVRKYLRDGITEFMKLLQHYPAFNRIILDSEVESIQEMDFSEQSMKMAKEALGFEPPMSDTTEMEIDNYAGVRVTVPKKIKDATPTVFPNDNKYYRFMHYLWDKGYGDNLLRVDAAEVIRKYRPDMMIYHEPYRDVPLASRMEGMDFGGTWYYSFPDGAESFMATESLLSVSRAMGKPEGFQIDPSLWLYQHTIGPSKSRQAGVHPYSLYISALHIAFAAKPTVIELFDLGFTMPGSGVEFCPDNMVQKLSDYSKNVVKPLWSATRRLDREPRKAALLTSFGSQIFDNCYWGGWGRQAQNAVLSLLWRANIPTAILSEENIRMGELDRYDQLFLHKTTRLPQDIFDAVKKFAARGGTIVVEPGSPWKALLPNAVEFAVDTDMIAKSGYWSIHNGNGFTADVVHNEQQKTAQAMRKLFRKDGLTFADSNSTELFVQTLKTDDCAYVFLQNDKRTFGDYFGKKYKAVLDQGLPLTADVTLKHKGAVYEFPGKKLSDRCPGKYTIEFKPSEYKILILYPEPVASLGLKSVPAFKATEKAVFQITVNNAKGKQLRGVQPVKVVLTAPDGKKVEQYLSAENGLVEFSYIPAKNEPSGTWKLEAEELASGIKFSKTFKK